MEIAIPYFHAMTPNEAVALTQFGLRQNRYDSPGCIPVARELRREPD